MGWIMRMAGAACLLAGLLGNKFYLEQVLARDHDFSDAKLVIAIIIAQAAFIVAGVLLSIGAFRAKLGRIIAPLALVASVFVIGLGVMGAKHLYLPSSEEQLLAHIDRSEEVYLALSSSETKTLSEATMNLRMPNSGSRYLFADKLVTADIVVGSQPQPVEHNGDLGTQELAWTIGETETVGVDELDLWKPMFDYVDYFDYAKVYIIFSNFSEESEVVYETNAGFKGRAILPDDRVGYVHGKLDITFEKTEDDNWRITKFITREMAIQVADEFLFVDAMASSIPDADLRRSLTQNIHEDFVRTRFLKPDQFKPPIEGYSDVSADRHPGIAVVDVDQDGWDDIYVMSRFGENVLLRNNRDGTFRSAAAKYGLGIADHSAAAIFADFDNDGDDDLFLGRTMQRSMYLENQGGRFVDRSSDLVDGPLPYFVSSVTATDFNGDGLLDVYFSTYVAHILANDLKRARQEGRDKVLSEYLNDEEATELFRLNQEDWAHRFTAFPGPPNVLLINKGGRFERVKDPGPLAVWRNTYQSTWADIDGDGDQDLYVANDFSVNKMIRNNGDGTFTDITAETQTSDVGFGMGATFGDYDGDGRQDLYVTNMFSKAGQRVTKIAGDLGIRFAPMAEGNTLFRNLGETFEKTSDPHDHDWQVNQGGWGWGSQFVDLDNDSWLDIYGLSGYYSAPKEVAIAEDT